MKPLNQMVMKKNFSQGVIREYFLFLPIYSAYIFI